MKKVVGRPPRFGPDYAQNGIIPSAAPVVKPTTATTAPKPKPKK